MFKSCVFARHCCACALVRFRQKTLQSSKYLFVTWLPCQELERMVVELGDGHLSPCFFGNQNRYLKQKHDVFLTLTNRFLCLNLTRASAQHWTLNRDKCKASTIRKSKVEHNCGWQKHNILLWQLNNANTWVGAHLSTPTRKCRNK